MFIVNNKKKQKQKQKKREKTKRKENERQVMCACVQLGYYVVWPSPRFNFKAFLHVYCQSDFKVSNRGWL